MWFKRWNIVIAKVNKDPSIEAVVDFETKDGKVYISEWWRPLTYPTRLIVDKNMLFLKDKKIKIGRQRMQELIREFFREDLDYLNLMNLDNMKIWDRFKFNNRRSIYLQDYENGYKILWEIQTDYNWEDYIAYLYWVSNDELSESLRTKDQIIHTIFWCTVKESDIVIVDDTTGESIEQ